MVSKMVRNVTLPKKLRNIFELLNKEIIFIKINFISVC